MYEHLYKLRVARFFPCVLSLGRAKMFSRLISVLLLSRCAFAQMDALTNVTNAFSMAQIVPDVIDSFTPMDLLNITFTDSVTMEMINVDPGDLLTEER